MAIGRPNSLLVFCGRTGQSDWSAAAGEFLEVKSFEPDHNLTIC